MKCNLLKLMSVLTLINCAELAFSSNSTTPLPPPPPSYSLSAAALQAGAEHFSHPVGVSLPPLDTECDLDPEYGCLPMTFQQAAQTVPVPSYSTSPLAPTDERKGWLSIIAFLSLHGEWSSACGSTRHRIIA